MNFIQELGPLAIGSRIKSLAESLMKDMTRIYKEYGVDFEPRWFTLFQLVLRKKEITVMEIARELHQSHPAVVQVLNSLDAKDLIVAKKDSADSRKRIIRLSRKGEKLARNLGPLWEIVLHVSQEILNESDPVLLDRIAEVEKVLENKSVYMRVKDKMIREEIASMEFKEFEEKYKDSFRILNEHWLTTYLEITNHDRKVLDDPVKEIIGREGNIYFLVSGDEVAGTYAMKKLGQQDCEILKFTIKENYRGLGLGRKMLEHAIGKAEEKHYRNIYLITAPLLVDAVLFYKRNGFETVAGHPNLIDETGRCSITMRLPLNRPGQIKAK